MKPAESNEAPVCPDLGIRFLLRRYPAQVSLTWILVLVENALVALIPLFIGRSIDGLIQDQRRPLLVLLALFGGLVVVAVGRRTLDTRAYGTMRVLVGTIIAQRLQSQPISRINARLQMGREFVDFLEDHVPDLMTAIVQVSIAFLILLSFDISLGASAAAAVFLMFIIYAGFHRRIYFLNRDLNEQDEQQVRVLSGREPTSILGHLTSLRRHEVRLSDTLAVLYGIVFLLMAGFVVMNLILAAQLGLATAGKTFSIVSYSWSFVEAGFAFPTVLERWTRLGEIKDRVNLPKLDEIHDE